MADTLVMINNTLVPGNYVPVVPQSPSFVAVDDVSGKVFATGWTGPSLIAVINESTHQILRTVRAGLRPSPLYYVPATGDVYVGNYGGSTVSVLNGSTGQLVGTFPVGQYPDTLAGDPSGATLYVGNAGSRNISVVSTATGKTLRSLALPWQPTSLAYDSWNGLLYVTNGGSLAWEPCSRNVTAIDPATGAVVATVSLPYECMEGVTFDPSNGDVFVANGQGNITVVDGTTNLQVASIQVPGFASPISGDMDRANGRLYFADVATGGMDIIDGSTRTFQGWLPGGTFAIADAVDNHTQQIYLANQGSSNLTVFSAPLNRSIASIPFSSQPGSIAFDPANGDLYVVDQPSSSVIKVSGATELVTGSIPISGTGSSGISSLAFDPVNGDLYVGVGPAVEIFNASTGGLVKSLSGMPTYTPNEIFFDPANNRIFVTSGFGLFAINGSSNTLLGSVSFPVCGVPAGGLDAAHQQVYFAYQTCGGFNGVAAVNATTLVVQATISTGAQPDGVSSDPYTGQVFVADGGTSNVTVIDGSTHQVVGSIPTGPIPAGGCYSPVDGRIYVPDSGGNVSVINSTTDTVVAQVAVGADPTTDLCAAPGGLVVVSNTGSGTLSFLAPPGILPVLSSVIVTPSIATVYVGGHLSLGAAPGCTGGPCPGPATYQWTLVNGMGSLNQSLGALVNFTAGSVAGTETAFVNATVNGRTVRSLPVIIQVLLPTLSSVSVTPPSTFLTTGSTAMFMATLGCTGGPCPGGGLYAWSETNALGALSGTASPTLTFTALSSAGTDTVFLNVTLNGVTLSGGPVSVTITLASSLVSVNVSPSSASLAPGATQVFSASPTCTSACAAGITYRWSGAGPLGSLNSTTGSVVLLTAGTATGTFQMFVNATLLGKTVQSGGVAVSILSSAPALSGVAISPATSSISTGGTETFSAGLTCTGGACPSGATYAWSVTGGGTLSGQSAASTTFTAGSAAVTVRLFLNVTLNGISQGTSAAITITSGSGSAPPPASLLGVNVYLLIALVAALLAAVAGGVFYARRKGRRGPVAPSITASSPNPATAPSPAPGAKPPEPRPSPVAEELPVPPPPDD